LTNESLRTTRELKRLRFELQTAVDQLPRLRQMVELSRDMLVILDSDGNIQDHNRRLNEAVGVARTELYNTKFADLFLYPSRAMAWQKEWSPDDINLTQMQLKGPSGAPVPVELEAHQIQERNQHIVLVSVRDLSQQMAHQRALKGIYENLANMKSALELQHNAELTARVHALNVLADSVAHELNNILTVISANLFMLEMDNTDPDLKGMLEDIRKGTDQGKEIAARFMAFSQRSSFKRPLIDPLMWLPPILKQVAKDKEFRLSMDIQRTLPTLELIETEMVELINHLAQNSFDAMKEPGRWKIKAHRPTLSDGSTLADYVDFRFEDTGPGVPKEIQDKIFESGFTTREGKMGLGLAHCARVAESHRGRIRLDVDNTEGAAFVVSIPMPDRALTPVTNIQSSFTVRPGVQILVAEPNTETRSEIRRRLSKYGVEVTGCKSEEEALKRYAQNMKFGTPYDLVLVNIHLQDGESGLWTLSQLQTIQAGVHAVAIIRREEVALVPQFTALGFRQCLQLPLLRSEIEDMLRPYRQN